MTIEENIVHLKSQKELFKLTIVQKENQIQKLEEKLGRFYSGITTLQSLATSFRADIYKLNGEISDSEIERKIFLKVQLKNYTTCLENFYLLKDNLIRLSADWQSNLEKTETLPKNKFTEEDENKLNFLAKFFRNNLNKFGYRSVNNLNYVSISKETYLPIINKFDMKFDSSASDHICSIWSFTLAILQTSEKFSGKHQNILILDEPGQHSIIDKDLGSLFNVLNSLQSNNQFIVGLTLPEVTLENLLKENNVEKYNVVNIENRAFN
ncbi:TPA: hypothetical protein ACP2U2_000646 [Listeria monocytogenes]|uniref:hypothetical protein n=1 Tax=Listeria TaxID=1637 RepID=UPI00074D5513|nr:MULTISPECIES: hypothetical protein [Listeria]EAE3024511.1 hypothetical protein [Listeria monocytogenes]EAE4088487.1 hypothetical protein [Listeria monocytogenes]EAE4593385.1 hypothetical protein [Listeria monocytogenes]EAF1314634.1 hypothetical protein [Listeria monocytogenes]EEO9457421.1 hypothetical protein [Listeria monocytogenes]